MAAGSGGEAEGAEVGADVADEDAAGCSDIGSGVDGREGLEEEGMDVSGEGGDTGGSREGGGEGAEGLGTDSARIALRRVARSAVADGGASRGR